MRTGETIEAPTMGQRVTCRDSAASTGGELLRFDFWMRGGAVPLPLHIHPRQEERILVVSGSVRSTRGGIERVIGPGETVVSPSGEPHTVGPAGEEAVVMLVEFRPALGYEHFIERTFALDRAGYINAKGRGNPCVWRPRNQTRPSLPSPRPGRNAASHNPRAGLARPPAPRLTHGES
jgi:mannose-6-phosphate isomerase-like protein (cupin superfamily)